ncbi:MAG: zinc ribbon domain-containing protein [Chloroflexi bacterium]|nr:zinc ribbon domain-containing protein [Chloroflexota bacterium]
MPIYEYCCAACKKEFELMRPLSQMGDPAPCPSCGAEGQRLISAFASKVDYYIKASTKPPFREPASR